jgi:hypothetical protein
VGLASAVAAASHMTRLSRLELNDNAFAAAGAERLIGAAHLAGLTHLVLRNDDFDSKAALVLARAPHFKRLISLDLAGNSIRIDGKEALIERYGKDVCSFSY